MVEIPIKQFLAELQRLGVKIWADGGRLRSRSPKGVLTPPLRQILRERKAEILAFLQPANTRSKSTIKPVPRHDALPLSLPGAVPLSFAQQRLWFLAELEGSSASYNIPTVLRLEGPLDEEALRWSFNEIIKRHEILRTTFSQKDGQAYQKIAESGHPFSLSLITLDDSPHKEHAPRDEGSVCCAVFVSEGVRQRALSLAAQEANQPFDLVEGPLWRVTLLRLSETNHLLLLIMHHIISDGWSTEVLLRELSVLYTGYMSGQPAPLPELAIQYADFAVWQRAWLTGERLNRHLAYWKEQLAAAPPLLTLPTDRPRPAVQSFRGDYFSFTLPQALTRSLKQLTQQQSCTLFMTLQAAFALLLSRYSGQDDILIGSPIANRQQKEIEPLIGFFVNTLVLRNDLSGNPTFLEFLRRVRQVALDAYQQQALPFELLVESLQPERSLSHNPLFQVMFDLHLRQQQESFELAGVTISPMEVSYPIAKFDLSLSLEEQEEGLMGWWEYSTDLFERATIERMAVHFQTLLESIVANPSQRIAHLPLLTEREHHQLLVEWNDTATSLLSPSSPPKHVLRNEVLGGTEGGRGQCIHQLFEQQVARTPEAIAVVFENQQLTYRELNARANQLAYYLIELGVAPDILVGICIERSLEMMVGLLGILKAGGAYVPLDPSYPQERLQFMLQDSGVQVLLTESKLVDALGAGLRVLCLDSPSYKCGEGVRQRAENPQTSVQPNHLAYCIYTSGSTGRPKGVQICHQSLTNFLHTMSLSPGLTASDKLLAVTTISFDIAALELYLPLVVGAQLILASREESSDGQLLLEKLPDATVMQATPATWRMLLASGWQGSDIKLLCGGEALPHDLARELRLRGRELWNMYGPTETTIWSTTTQVTKELASQLIVSIGRPIGNTQLYLLDRHLRPVPIGVSGELHIGGAGVARGYLKRPQLTKEKFIPNPYAEGRLYKTGDLCRYLPDGNIEFLGRIDYQVKIRGFRIELGEIEALLSQHEAVREVVVVVREETTGKRLVAYLVCRGNAKRTPSGPDMQAYLSLNLPDYMIPSAFVQLEAMPLTPNGKIDRRALPAPEYQPEGKELVLPRTPKETILAAIWQELLGLKQVGVHDNFFEVGGHSLLATQVVSRIRQTFQVELPLRRLFEFPTIAQLAPHLTEGTKGLPPIQPAQRQKAPPSYKCGEGLGVRADLPLSFAQERLWFLAQLEGASATYNMHDALRLSGPLSKAALEWSLNEISARHEVLRTTFITKASPEASRVREGGNSQAYQKIAPPTYFKLTVIDLAAWSPEGREAEVQRLASRAANQPFDLSKGPLWRVSLLRLSEESHVLLLTMHHIISDGWSTAVFTRELSALYRAYTRGEPSSVRASFASPLPKLEIQYADFALWQRTWLTGEVLNVYLAYWKEQLADAPPLLTLPTDHPRPAVQSFRGDSLSFTLPQALTKSLKQLTQQQSSTLFMTLQATFALLLSRYSGQDDILIGTPIANRQQREIEPLIGFFVNTLVLRNDLSGNPTALEFLRSVRQVALDAYQQQALPFELLVESLQPERSLSHSALFQVMFVWQNNPPTSFELEGVTISPMEESSPIAKFDLTLAMQEQEEGLSLMGLWEYNKELFERATIERMTGHFQTLLEAIVSNPSQRITELPLLTEAERHQLLVEWNNTATSLLSPSSPPKHVLRNEVLGGTEGGRGQCIHQLFEQQVERTPEATALIFPPSNVILNEVKELGEQGGAAQQLTYRELNCKANQLAYYLMQQGVGADVLVAICVERSIEMVVGVLAILKAGGAYVPLDPAYPAERLRFMLEDTQVPLLLTQEKLAPTLPQVVPLFILDQEWELIQGQPDSNPQTLVSSDKLAYCIYTSGSTGRPKGVLVEHQSLCNLALAQIRLFDVQKNSKVVQVVSFSFDVATADIFMALCCGATLCLANSHNSLILDSLTEALDKQAITHLELPASILAALPFRELPALETIIVGGEACPTEVIAQWSKGRHFFNAYGPTEATICATMAKLSPSDISSRYEGTPPIGRPIPNTQIYILDPHLQPVPIGVPGELHIGGVGLAREYLNRPQLTKEKFIPNPFGPGRLYKTGDLCRYRPDGNIEFLGRIDTQVKIRGLRIELGEIEALLSQHPEVRTAVVIARQDEVASSGSPSSSRRLVAYVVSKHPVSQLSLRAYLAQTLPDYMLPSAFVQLDSMPLTPNGKIDRRRLPAPEYGPLAEELLLPRTPTEELLAAIWQELLTLERVGVHDNFFEVGGHSLLATQVVSRIRESFHVELPLRRLFDAPTIAQLALELDQASQVVSAPIEPASRSGELALSFAQQRLWFLSKLEATATYNIPAAFRLFGPLDEVALEHSLRDLEMRHETLRTTFPQKTTSPEARENLMPHQQINPPSFQLEIVSLSHLPYATQELQVQRLASQEANRLFDLTNGPLWHVTLARLGSPSPKGVRGARGEGLKHHYLLLVTMHHIISDGWSMALFTSELTALYQAYISGKPSPLPELEIQYADFSLWQRAHIGDVLTDQLAYWKEQLADAPPLLTLPTDYPRPAVQSYRGDTHSLTLPKKLTTSLKNLSQQHSCTLFMTLQAAFALLLSRYSGLDDILVGTPIANRQQKEIEPLIGFFVNTLVLRNDLSGNPTFLEFLQRVRQMALDAYQHQALPFERLVETLQPERTLSQNPLFQVMFDMQNTRQSHFELELVTVTPLEVPESTAKFDLSLSLEEQEESSSLIGWWEYSTDLFEEATIERMASHFQTLLEAIVSNPSEGSEASQPIAHLPLLTEAERHQLLREWNDTLWPSAGVPRVKLPGGIQIDEPFDKCFHQLFEEQVARTPEAIAALFENQQLTYSELNARANHLSHILVESGVEAEKIVGLLGERNLDFLTGILAIFKAGGVYLPLDPFLPVERLSHMMKQSQATLILASKTKRVEQRLSEIKGRGEIQVLWLDQQPTLSDNPCSPPFSDNPCSPPFSDNPCSPRCGPNNLAYVIFTSGSTGLPKGAMIEHKGMLNHLYAIWLDFELTSRDTVAQNASQCFDISVWQFLLPLIVGGRVHIFNDEVARDPEELLAQVAANGITILEVVPSLLRVMLESNVDHDPSTCSGHSLSKLRWLIPTGEALPPELSRQWFKRYPDIPMMNAYGPAECADDVTFYPIYQPPAPDVVNMPIGRPVINMQMYILDPHLQPVPIGVAGELYIGGIGVGRGYLHDAQRTKQAFMSDPFGRLAPSPTRPLAAGRLYKTGDWGRYLPDGNIEFLGRIDHQVKIRGFRIELGEIEAALTQHPEVREAVVIVREEGGKRLVAYLVSSEPISNHDLRRHLSQKLPATMIPSAFVQLEAMPLTPNGKIDRRKLPVPDSSSLALTGSYLPPRNSTEQQLVHIWQEVLGLHSVGVRENFFDLGGHSLLAVRLMALIQQHFGVNLALAMLFQSPTIEQLATRLVEPSHLVSYVGKSDWSSLVPIQPNGEKPPFFCVPGVGGNVLYFYDLARRMYAEQPFYGLQSVGLDGETAPYSTAEEVAAHYIKAIQSIQPEGPYLLGGHSLGGEIIFEMAQQLAGAGHDVARLMIFDTSAPIPRPEPSEATWDDAQWLVELSEAIGASIGQASEVDYDSLLLLDPEEQLIRFQDELKRLDFPVGSALNQVRGWLQVFKSNSLIHYVPQDVIPMPITLFQAEEAPSIDGERDKQEALRRQEPTWGWNQFANGPVEVISVPGNHMTMMTPPHIEVLVERLLACLERAVEL